MERTIAEPVLASGPMTCRRGTGSRASVQGQPVPRCNGIVMPSPVRGWNDRLACTSCGLVHEKIVMNAVQHYGAVL